LGSFLFINLGFEIAILFIELFDMCSWIFCLHSTFH